MKRRSLLALPAAFAAACGPKGKRRVAVIPKAVSHLFWVSVQAGCAAGAREFNLELLWNGPASETDYSRQIQIVDSMVAQRVDGIAIAASERRALIGAVDRAVAAGIPVTIFDSGLDSENYMSWVGTDNVEAGRMGGRALAAFLQGKGDVAILLHAPGSVSTMDREQGFHEVMAKEFPGIRIVAEQFGMSDKAKSRAAAENILAAHSGLDGFFASTEPSAAGVSLALKARDLAGKVKFVGFDSSDAMIEDLRTGVLDATVIQDPFRMGFETVKTLADKIAGKTPPKRVALQGHVVTKANLDTPEIQQMLHPGLMK
jgi:ribose transport system substrate-binding protein